MTTKIQELKETVKQQAKDIRELKGKTKEVQRSRKYAGELQFKLHCLRRDNRHYHIAYSELRGKTRDQIENPNEENLPIESEIRHIKARYYEEPEAICVGT